MLAIKIHDVIINMPGNIIQMLCDACVEYTKKSITAAPNSDLLKVEGILHSCYCYFESTLLFTNYADDDIHLHIPEDNSNL